MPEFTTLEAYAEHIRRETFHLHFAVARALGEEHPAAERAFILHAEAARIVTGGQMETERAEVEQLDLAKLPPVFVSDSADPFREE